MHAQCESFLGGHTGERPKETKVNQSQIMSQYHVVHDWFEARLSEIDMLVYNKKHI